MNTLDLTKISRGTNLGFIKKCLRILQLWRTHTLGYLDACLRSESLSSTLQIQPSPLLLLPDSLARITHRGASLF